MINIPIATASATSSSALDLASLEIEAAVDMAKQYLTDMCNDTVTMKSAVILAGIPQYVSWTYPQIVDSETAMTAVAASETAMTAVIASDTALSAVVASETAMTAVAASETAMTAVAASETAMTAVIASDTALCAIAKTTVTTAIITFFKTLNTKVAYLQAAYDTVTGSGLFTSKTTNYQDTVKGLDQYGTTSYAGKAIILTATGCYSDSSSYTIVSINGTQVSTNKRVNTERPQSVTRNSIGAVSVPDTTWTESGDGYAAIAVYTAK